MLLVTQFTVTGYYDSYILLEFAIYCLLFVFVSLNIWLIYVTNWAVFIVFVTFCFLFESAKVGPDTSAPRQQRFLYKQTEIFEGVGARTHKYAMELRSRVSLRTRKRNCKYVHMYTYKKDSIYIQIYMKYQYA